MHIYNLYATISKFYNWSTSARTCIIQEGDLVLASDAKTNSVYSCISDTE